MLPSLAAFALDALLIAALVALSFPPGLALVRELPGLARWEKSLLAAVAGLGLIGSLLGLLALAHGFDRPRILALVAAVEVSAFLMLRRQALPTSATEPRPAERGWLAALPLLAALPAALLLALYPAAAFDDTLYHLPLARSLFEHGGTVFEPHLRFPLFPLFQEGLIAALFALGGGGTGAHLLAAAELALLGGVVALWSRRLTSPEPATLAGALLLGCPLLAWLGSIAYVDLALSLYAVTALLAVAEHESSGHPGWLALASGCAGVAAATKYHGLFFLGVVGLAVLRAAWRARRPSLLLAPAAAVLLTAFPWYLRNLLVSGNPVFPFLTALFGPNEWTLPEGTLLHGGGPGALALDLVRLPWLLLVDAFDPATVPPFSPFAAVVLPVVAVLGLRRPETRWIAALALVYVTLWLAGVRDARYLVPAAALLAVVTAVEVAPLAGRLRPWAVLALAALLLAPAWGFAGLRVVKRGLPPFTEAARARYLDRWLPGHALLIESASLLGPGATVYGLHTEQLQDCAPGRLLGDWNGPYRFAKIEPLLGDPERLATELGAMGADALLTPQHEVPAPSGTPLRLLARGGGFELWALKY